MANQYTKNDTLFVDIENDPMFKQGGIVTTAKIQQQSGVTPYKLVDAVDIDWNGATFNNVKKFVQLAEEPAEADKADYYVKVGDEYVKYDATQHSEYHFFYELVPEIISDTSDLIGVLDTQFAKISAATGDLGDWIAQITANSNAISALNNAGYVTAQQASTIAATQVQTYVTGGDNISVTTENGYTYVTAYDLVTASELASYNYATESYAYSAANTAAAEAVAAIVAGADASYDTLKEIADYIASDIQGTAQLVSQVGANTAAIGTAASGDDPATGLYAAVATAQSTADTAYTNASAAVSTANDAYTLAETAAATADEAYTTANTAYTTANDAYTLANTAYNNAYAAVSTANAASDKADSAYTLAQSAYALADATASDITILKADENTEGSISYRIKAMLEAADKKAEALSHLNTTTTEEVGNTTVSYSYVASQISYTTIGDQTSYSVDFTVKYGDANNDGIALYSTVKEMVALAVAEANTYSYNLVDWLEL